MKLHALLSKTLGLLTHCVCSAHAHLLPAQNATMNIIDNAVFFVVSVPVSALEAVDDNGDGLLSNAEIQRNSSAIVSQFQARFHMTDGGKAGEAVLSWVVPPQTDHTVADSNYIVVMHRINFPGAVSEPIISTDLFGTGPGEAQMTMAATRNFAKPPGQSASEATPAPQAQIREVAILRPGASTHKFFRGAWANFFDFIRIGCEHILSGIDHLLFLLTIIVAAAGWRYWFGVLTSFTIAHSITLSLSTFNLVRIPADIVEPSIAASIVMMAALNLRALHLAKANTAAVAHSVQSHWLRIAIVFACGLLHGFGFASVIGAMAVDAKSQIATILGFNIGIELGQFFFVAAVLLGIGTVKKLGLIRIADQLPSIASYIAIVLGLWFFLQRIGVF